MNEIGNMTNSLANALKHFEIAEANLTKLEKLWDEIRELIPSGLSFGSPPEYEEKCQLYKLILPHLSKIDGWVPSTEPMEFDSIAQSRLDAMEIGEISVTISVENQVDQPGLELRQYRFKLNQKRKELTRVKMSELIDSIDSVIRDMSRELDVCKEHNVSPEILPSSWETLDSHVSQIDTLLGSTKRPPRWSDLQRHIFYAKLHDFSDVKERDWPIVKHFLLEGIYEENDPIPLEVEDLSTLVAAKPKGSIDKINWTKIDPEDFERLIYTLLSSSEGYENPQWLMHTNAPDRGRDLSVERVVRDSLSGVQRQRVIIQCKHWLSKSISVAEIQTLQGQMKLWEPPRVDVHIIATTGRFSADGVALIEKNNQSDQALKIEMWPESHLEMILAKRPDLIAQFKLR
jgi:hypothetical protein